VEAEVVEQPAEEELVDLELLFQVELKL